MNKKKVVIISATSDIGTSLIKRWLRSGYEVVGTYRSKNRNYYDLKELGVVLQYMDMLDKKTIVSFVKYCCRNAYSWDILVFCPATQEPIGRFTETNFDSWEESIVLNLTSQLRVLHGLIPLMSNNAIPSIVFFAGGGTNGATENYSAYTIAKIASIKITELLDFEIKNAKFSILGPGWVKTKIHDATIKAKDAAGSNYEKTLEKLDSDECTPMEKVLDSIDWIVKGDKDIVGGRNFSTVFDRWGDECLENELRNDSNMYKLRRCKNDWK